MSDLTDADKVVSDHESREMIDLTAQQTSGVDSATGGVDDMDDFDLLDATIDPMDLKTIERVRRLEEDIEYEKSFIAMKMAYRYSMTLEDPMKIIE
jgi:hypothetical protein